MDLRKLKTLIDLVSESGISELEVNEGEDRVRIVNAGSPAPVGQMVYANPAPAMQATPAASAPVATAPAAEAPAVETGSIARSPMVGTFYRAPNPESPNFVNIGDTVKVGQTLCIIEAMKLLNEIESEHAGVIKEILCENGQGVEFDQPLFIIA
ncbi:MULTISPECIES: acetyl-CoA carboxylase biotin carboxyl carrier protein [unclassified Polynucleobacter]|jgi:acetyl-CoA carboxylase biotin carboxyl carrier protein|uniref:acetyl-CoA carboxylase biotin carboxyl carrier protein n=1 Tax=unclassified Polynucleobacter TaxID=2640945 RepID=UPI001BFD0716|nr:MULTISPECIES: acetyl-CoA carboxylase biotin carboxyl carrier protein [unclassified Polynucleobacter]MBU3547741.1 acetyl-CoA carboxylase biotin carboxyl carrier protein [Polynucleobacter sp. P1-05-14]MBU3638427.1 acetyl-CoA carboxylase biotin carboxyl carrier protein [Polynucleobacter sp. AP-RePozz3-80-G7]MEA9600992.1 acetyl-CoA carboxylase biotin carboxyl carrier protein [Polynucleobacter sp. MG-28-Ekke-A2]QWD81821.1 acetyl-CoA carboxylase biotin carboxyl carrier protein [Polynucleobacter sp